MFSIDLLKGKGLPETIDLKWLLVKVVPILIPLLALTAGASMYQHQNALLQKQQQELKNNQQEIELYQKDVLEYRKNDTQIKGLQKCLNDISKAMGYRIQVSQLLVELSETLPETIFIYEMNLDRKAVKEKIQESDSGEVKQRLVVYRNLKLILCGFDAEKSDLAVQQYINNLNQSSFLKSIFTEIKPSARQQGEVEGRPAIYYELECALREQSK